MSSDAQKVEILFKKYSGVADTIPGANIGQEPPVNARAKIVPDVQIFAQSIPTPAPTNNLPLPSLIALGWLFNFKISL